jgi:hypothetical protein
MITLFESFNDKINLKDYLINKNENWKIPIYDFNMFGKKKPKYYSDIKYNSLMRFYLYLKLLNYTGNNSTILNYIKGLVDKDEYKIEVINKIPNNNHVFSFINKKFRLNYPSYSYDNLQDLKKLINNIDSILDDINLSKYIEMVESVSIDAKESEKVVKGVMVMLFGRYYNIKKPSVSDDLKGVDLWMINKETSEPYRVQIKNVIGNNFLLNGDTIYIKNTGIDLHKYEYWKDKKLPYDYLAFYLKKHKRICLIKSTAIFAIDRPSKREIKIKLKKWAFDYKSTFKMIDIPKKLLPKDYSKVFYK